MSLQPVDMISTGTAPGVDAAQSLLHNLQGRELVRLGISVLGTRVLSAPE